MAACKHTCMHMLFVLAVSSLLLAVHAQIPRQVVLLDQDSFEPSTEATTGQNAGIWFVLFNDRTHPRSGEVNALWMQLAYDDQKEFIAGEVFLNDLQSRALAWQFDQVQPPAAILFRDQMMYTYPRPLHEKGALEKLHEFAREGYLNVAPERVPGSLFGQKDIEEVQEEWVKKQKAGFDWKTALFGVCCLLFAYKLKSWARKKKSEEILEKKKQEQELQSQAKPEEKQQKNSHKRK